MMSSLIVTMGIVPVACWATRAARLPPVKIASTFIRTSFGARLGKLLRTSLRVAQLERDVLALDQTRCAQSLPKRFHPGKYGGRVGRPQQADGGHAALLCAHAKRPGCRAAEKRDELAPPHVLPLVRGSDPTTSL